MMTQYTAYVAWPALYGDRQPVEEVDVQATSLAQARSLAEAELAAHYVPGWVIIRIGLTPVVHIWSW